MTRPANPIKRPNSYEDIEHKMLRERLKTEVKIELRPILYKEAEALVTERLTETLRKDIEAELAQKFKERLPSAVEKERVSKAISRLRVDCIVRAQTASEVVDNLVLARTKRYGIFKPLTIVLLASILPLMYYLSAKGLGLGTLGWWATIGSISFIATMSACMWSANNEDDNSVKLLRNGIGEYTNLARKFETLELSIDTRTSMTDLAEMVDSKAREKDQLDKLHYLSIKDMKRVRVVVHEDQVIDTSPEEFLRVPHTEVDELLEVDEESNHVRKTS